MAIADPDRTDRWGGDARCRSRVGGWGCGAGKGRTSQHVPFLSSEGTWLFWKTSSVVSVAGGLAATLYTHVRGGALPRRCAHPVPRRTPKHRLDSRLRGNDYSCMVMGHSAHPSACQRHSHCALLWRESDPEGFLHPSGLGRPAIRTQAETAVLEVGMSNCTRRMVSSRTKPGCYMSERATLLQPCFI